MSDDYTNDAWLDHQQSLGQSILDEEEYRAELEAEAEAFDDDVAYEGWDDGRYD